MTFAGSVLCALAPNAGVLIAGVLIAGRAVPPSGTTTSAGGPGNAAVVQQVSR